MGILRIGTSILDILGTLYGYFTGPLVAVMILGIYSRRVNGRGAFGGLLAGVAAVGCMARFTDIFWLWYGPTGLAAALVFSWILSLLLGAPPSEEQLAASHPKDDEEASPGGNAEGPAHDAAGV